MFENTYFEKYQQMTLYEGSNKLVHVLIFRMCSILITVKFKKLQWHTFFGISEKLNIPLR